MPAPMSLARQIALQILFAHDANDGIDDLAALEVALGACPDDPKVRAAGMNLAAGAWEHRRQSDAMVEQIAPQWPVRRQPAVDRAVLRLAIYELFHRETPPKVVLDQAIELAKQFSTEHSGAFVNGVLDAALKQRRALLGSTPDRTDRDAPDTPNGSD